MDCGEPGPHDWAYWIAKYDDYTHNSGLLLDCICGKTHWLLGAAEASGTEATRDAAMFAIVEAARLANVPMPVHRYYAERLGIDVEPPLMLVG